MTPLEISQEQFGFGTGADAKAAREESFPLARLAKVHQISIHQQTLPDKRIWSGSTTPSIHDLTSVPPNPHHCRVRVSGQSASKQVCADCSRDCRAARSTRPLVASLLVLTEDNEREEVSLDLSNIEVLEICPAVD